MDIRLLTDTIVRQTTVLLAQIATSSGIRAPLAHVANQVFLDLAQELEAQGVRKKVVADMFGLALRSYQIKVRRLLETSDVQRSTWHRVFARLEAGPVTRRRLADALPTLSARDMSAVLNDLVDSGLAYSSGTGPGAVYGATSQADRMRLGEDEAQQSLQNRLWLVMAARDSFQTEDELLREAGQVSPESFNTALEELIRDGRVKRHQPDDGDASYEALDFHIPVGSEQGWEAAVCDHFAAVSTAVAAKLATARSRGDDVIGGATLRFRVHPDHPHRTEVRTLLQRTREQVGDLWRRVAAYNESNPPPEDCETITFYYGQNSNAAADAESNPNSSDISGAEQGVE
jgi:DNA-binding HxlR family transcriptional regulator